MKDESAGLLGALVVIGGFWFLVGVGLQISDWIFQNVKCDISGILWGVFSVQPGPRMGLIQEETGGSSGYDHPSPSIPLPVEGRGKPVAMRPAGLETLVAV